MRSEAGFSLIEVVLATALFAFVALAGFDVLRALGGAANVLAQRANAAAQLRVASGALRSAALSSVAVWKPASVCGDALEFMRRDGGGTSFLLYTVRASALVRAAAPGPLDPCDPALAVQTVVAPVSGFTVTRFAASQLPAHRDPVSGNPDGGILVAGAITAVSVDAHASDAAGARIPTGNDIVEAAIDADPARTTVDLLAGNRPSAYTQVLAFTCDGRCEANGPFPELRGAPYTDCTAAIDFQALPTSFVPAAYGYVGAGGGTVRIVVTAYAVSGGYTFTFGGPVPLTLERAWPQAVWPPAGSPLAGTVSDPYPVDYAHDAVLARGPAQLAADLGEPARFAAELAACADLHADPTYGD
jgi:type II secretory pathway pseudopilin PulG